MWGEWKCLKLQPYVKFVTEELSPRPHCYLTALVHSGTLCYGNNVVSIQFHVLARYGNFLFFQFCCVAEDIYMG